MVISSLCSSFGLGKFVLQVAGKFASNSCTSETSEMQWIKYLEYLKCVWKINFWNH